MSPIYSYALILSGIKQSLWVTWQTKTTTLHNKTLRIMDWHTPGVPTTQNMPWRAGIQVFHYSAVWVWPDTRRMKKSLSWQSSFGQEAKQLGKQFIVKHPWQEIESIKEYVYEKEFTSKQYGTSLENKDQWLRCNRQLQVFYPKAQAVYKVSW